MTILVGVRCTDGVVVGSDSMATSSTGAAPVVQIPSNKKVRIIGGRVVFAGTGPVGLDQRFEAILEKCWSDRVFSNGWLSCAKAIAQQTVKDFQSTGVPWNQMSGYGYGALLAAPFSDQGELIEFGIPDFQPERKIGEMHFVSMGSGQVLADPFIAFIARVLWGKLEPTVEVATLGVYWALSHTIQYAPGGVGDPIRIATLRRRTKGQWRAELLEDEELEETSQLVGEIEKRIGQYPDRLHETAESEELPAIPEI